MVPTPEELGPKTCTITSSTLALEATFCGLVTVMAPVVPTFVDEVEPETSATAVRPLAGGATLASPTVRIDAINAMDTMHFDTTRAEFPRVQ
jgi:hypothetical protein